MSNGGGNSLSGASSGGLMNAGGLQAPWAWQPNMAGRQDIQPQPAVMWDRLRQNQPAPVGGNMVQNGGSTADMANQQPATPMVGWGGPQQPQLGQLGGMMGGFKQMDHPAWIDRPTYQGGSVQTPKPQTPFNGQNGTGAGGKGGYSTGAQAPNEMLQRVQQNQVYYAGGGSVRPLGHHPHRHALGIASLGRHGDSMLVHMSPQEVGSLQGLARAQGGSLTTNPSTGLPEANFLNSTLPMVAGAVLAPFTGGASAAAIVAAEEAIRQKDWKAGLMAGLGAYGGAGIGGALSKIGAGAAEGAAASGAASGAGAAGAGAAGAAGTGAGTAGMSDLAAAEAKDAAAAGIQDVAAPNMAAATQIGSQAASKALPMTMGDNVSAMGRGLGSLGQGNNLSNFAGSVGKGRFAMAAAPAVYQATKVPTYHATPEAPAEYWVPGKGYQTLYNWQSHGWNPGQMTQTAPSSYASGGTVDNNAELNKYLSSLSNMAMHPTMMNTDKGLVPISGTPTAPPPQVPPGTTVPPSGAPSPGGGIINQALYGAWMKAHPGQPMPNYGAGNPQLNPNYTPPGADPTAGGYFTGAPHRGGGRGRAGGGIINGMGDGTSDSVPAVIGHAGGGPIHGQPARLSKGEFVIPARIVSEIGNGSTDAGAQRLYAMMRRIEAGRKKVGIAGDSKAGRKLPA